MQIIGGVFSSTSVTALPHSPSYKVNHDESVSQLLWQEKVSFFSLFCSLLAGVASIWQAVFFAPAC